MSEAGGNPGYLSCTDPECPFENPQPVTNFYKQRSIARGYGYSCKTCLKRKNQERFARLSEKSCSSPQCLRNNPQPISEFIANSQRCKTCRANVLKDWNVENYDRLLSYRKKYYAENAEAQAEYHRKHYPRVAEARRAYSRAYGRANRDSIRMARRERIANSPEKYRVRFRQYRKDNPHLFDKYWRQRKRRMEEAAGSYTAFDIYKKLDLQGGLCYYCKAPLNKFEVDHKIPLCRGGTNWPANLCCACSNCNRQKSSRDFWEFIASFQAAQGLPRVNFPDELQAA